MPYTAAMSPATDTLSCSSCRACCCQLEVMLMAGDDDVPPQFIEQDAWGGEVMLRLDDGWCAALNRKTMMCSIYTVRPLICREYELGDHDCLEQRKRIPILSLPREQA
ncbi:hypothetical protein IGB42_03255 [Andreprevotia sp. IGB-42]|nr:hypothetical protein IGB42_03255 [Andreprevotia sp. IGB-42]